METVGLCPLILADKHFQHVPRNPSQLLALPVLAPQMTDYGPASLHHLTRRGLKVDVGTRHQAWESEIRLRGKYDDKGWN